MILRTIANEGHSESEEKECRHGSIIRIVQQRRLYTPAAACEEICNRTPVSNKQVSSDLLRDQKPDKHQF